MKLKSEFLFALLLMPLVAGADSSTPCMDALKKFTAPEVPALGPAETEVTPGRWGTNTMPAGLPGKGLAQHPMLYLGEGYNKMFLVNNGKIIWTCIGFQGANRSSRSDCNP